jgi:hypothetical protein
MADISFPKSVHFLEIVKRALHIFYAFGAYVGIYLSGSAAVVPQYFLDVAQVGAVFEQVRGVAQAALVIRAAGLPFK